MTVLDNVAFGLEMDGIARRRSAVTAPPPNWQSWGWVHSPSHFPRTFRRYASTSRHCQRLSAQEELGQRDLARLADARCALSSFTQR
ncbi:MAG: hypothetical protein R2856_37580 [Caldilineaceae bacterium]